jgi:hypothetical protein
VLLKRLVFLFGRIFLTIMSAIFLFPIVPKQVIFETRKLKINSRLHGFMTPCSSYEVVKPERVLLENN